MKERPIFVDRRNTDCAKWDALEQKFGNPDLLAMWVADMDFKSPESVLKALNDFMKIGAFGYYKVPASYKESFIMWEEKHHGLKVKEDWIRYAPGVVPAINWCVEAFTEPSDSVIVTTPVYYPFMNAVLDGGRKLVTSDLALENGGYTFDFEDFESKIKENDVKMFILCSPHNPVGRVWTLKELKTILDICRRHDVIVISDEIHHDFVYGENHHIPTLSAGNYGDMTVMLTAATKTFNLAGCQNSFVVIPDENLRKKFDSFAARTHATSGNPFGYIAVEAAYRGGEAWLESVKEIITGNYEYMKARLSEKLPLAKVYPLEGTYLMWIDFGAYLKTTAGDFMEQKCRLAFDHGEWFTTAGCNSFVRINLATDRSIVEKAADSICKNIK